MNRPSDGENSPAPDARRVGRLLLVPAWIVAAGLAGLVLTHFLAWDRLLTLTAFNAQTVWVYLPAYLIASAALCFRRFPLAVVALVGVVFHVWAIAATVGNAEPITADARAAPRLRVISANLKFDNFAQERLAREVLAADADVVFLQELTPRWLAQFEAMAGDDYPFREAEPLGGARGEAILSRLPLSAVRIDHPDGWPVISATVRVGDVAVRIVDIHVIGPTQGIDRHRRMVEDIAELISSFPEPRVVAGDFNSTPYNWGLRHLEDVTGLDNAHERRGRGLATTWPNRDHLGIPPVRIDHVLVDDQIVVLDIDELRGSGTDHRPVVADLAVLSGDRVDDDDDR
jgi:endonuclease/exonuclease/phosphatase (EEP) superfamily protein YafD